MPRRRTPMRPPRDYVTGDFLTGDVAGDAPVGVAETVRFARRLHNEIVLNRIVVAELADVDRSAIYDLLGGRTYPTVILLARLEHTLTCPLWEHD